MFEPGTILVVTRNLVTYNDRSKHVCFAGGEKVIVLARKFSTAGLAYQVKSDLTGAIGWISSVDLAPAMFGAKQ
jgi:hypothetical protein